MLHAEQYEAELERMTNAMSADNQALQNDNRQLNALIREYEQALEKVMNSFTAVFPSDAPRYALLVMLDEPKPTKNTYGYRTSGWNAAPTTGKIIARIAPLLGIEPKFDTPPMLPPGYTEASLGEIR